MPKIAGPNPPGLVMLIAFFADSIISMDEIHGGVVVTDPVLAEGSTAYAFFCSELGASHDQNQQLSEAGTLYRHQVGLNYASPEEQADELFRNWQNREFVLITTNYFGRRHLVGSKENPMLCNIAKSTGGESGIFGYKLSFSGDTYRAAPRFTGNFASAPVINPPVVTTIDFSEFDFNTQDFY